MARTTWKIYSMLDRISVQHWMLEKLGIFILNYLHKRGRYPLLPLNLEIEAREARCRKQNTE
ncbi:hypothetical protein ACS0TY_023512 [Phlomoides rotata]